MAATATATEAQRIWSSVKPRRRPNPTVERSSIPARIGICNPIPFLSTSFKTSSYSFIARASEEPQTQEAANSGSNDPDRAFISQEDVSYLWKLGAGSIVGAAVIKYGSKVAWNNNTGNLHITFYHILHWWKRMYRDPFGTCNASSFNGIYVCSQCWSNVAVDECPKEFANLVMLL
ncbi:unnamed protein product [Camellia sinensis]